MRKITSLALHGALAGGLGAACMTVVRMLAHRAGWISQMVPQAVEVWAKDQLHLDHPRTGPGHHAADQLLHVAYGSAWGAIYGASLARHGGPTMARAVTLGLPIWAFGSMVLFPALKIGRPAWRAEPTEALVDLGAHLLYGAVTVFITDELERQKITQPRLYPLSLVAPTG